MPPDKVTRRTRFNLLATWRAAGPFNRHSRAVRSIATIVALGVAAQSAHAFVAVPMVLVAMSGPGLNYVMAFYYRAMLPRLWPLRRIAAVTESTDSKHQLNVMAYLEILGVCLLFTAFSWVSTDLSAPMRLLGLLMAAVFTAGIAYSLFADQTWFNPAETSPPRWHEWLRRGAGPCTVALAALITLPAPWSSSGRLAAAVVVSLPLIVSARIWALDGTVAVLAQINDEERRRGRQLVLDETKAALTESLDALESLARMHRREAPRLHDLAAHAQSRLAAVLRLEDRQAFRENYGENTHFDTLTGPALTLARALGAAARVQVEMDKLSQSDAELAAWVLQDVVGNALNADAQHVDVTLASPGHDIEISVADDAPPMSPGVWKTPGTSSARLEAHLVSLSGGLDVLESRQGKVVTARWAARHGKEGLVSSGGEDNEGPGAAR